MVISSDAPFELDHAGFTASFRATSSIRWWGLALFAFALFWAGIVAYTVSTAATWTVVDAGIACTALFVVGVSAIGAEAAITRRQLRLTNGQLELQTRRLFARRRSLDLRGLSASAHERRTDRGHRYCHLVLELPSGQAVSIAANTWRLSDLRALAELLNRCAAQVDPETALVPPEALQSLRREAG